MRKYGRKVAKLTAQSSALRNKALKGDAKKTVGKTLSLVFLAEDQKEAWGDFNATWAGGFQLPLLIASTWASGSDR